MGVPALRKMTSDDLRWYRRREPTATLRSPHAARLDEFGER